MFHVKHTRTKTVDRRVHVALYGAVQGVGFRYFVRQVARALDLDGYVLNRSDGAVEVEASGPAAAVDEWLRTVENGPTLARVERVEVLATSADTLPSPFTIRH
jgi:acylphosphatase